MKRATPLILVLGALLAGCSTLAGIDEAERYDYQVRARDDIEWRYVYCGVRRVGELCASDPPAGPVTAIGAAIALVLNAAADTALLPITTALEATRVQRLRRAISERRHEQSLAQPEPPPEGGIVRAPTSGLFDGGLLEQGEEQVE